MAKATRPTIIVGGGGNFIMVPSYTSPYRFLCSKH